METFIFILTLLQLSTVYSTRTTNETVQNGGMVFDVDHLVSRCDNKAGKFIVERFIDDLMRKPLLVVPGNRGNPQCRLHGDILHEQASRFHAWALQMLLWLAVLDASAKIPSGILNGNLNQFGDFDQCLSSFGEYGDEIITGKYCLTNIEVKITNVTDRKIRLLDNLVHSHRIFTNDLEDPGHRIPKQETFSWGICMPSSCTSSDLQSALDQQLSDTLDGNAVRLRASVNEELCYVKHSKSFTFGNYFALVFFSSVLVIAALGTFVKTENNNESTIMKCLRCFSLKRNIKSLLQTDSSGDDLSILHGTRFLNALALLLSHKQMALMFNPFMNRTYMSEGLGGTWSMIGRSAILYTDSFIMISGMLASYSLVKELDRKKKMDVKEKFISRFVRFTPNLFAVIIFCTYVMEYLGSGPQWGLVVDRYANLCKNYMWRNLLYVHNYFGFENMCLTHTHQLGIDMQLYLVSPLVIYLLWKHPLSGILSCLVISAVSTWLRYLVTMEQQLSTVIHFGISVRRLWNTASLSYILPTHRATIYLLGILVGYSMRRGGKELKFGQLSACLGWIAAVSAAVMAMFGPYHMSLKGYVYNPTDAALYNAFSPILWGGFLSWASYACINGYGGWLNDLLSWKYFQIFTRISYALYLTQFPVFFYFVGTQRTVQYYKGIYSMFDVAEIFIVIAASVALTLLFDMPFQQLKKILWPIKNEDTQVKHVTNLKTSFSEGKSKPDGVRRRLQTHG